MGDPEDTTICPQCGGEYKRVGSHWAQSSTCDYAEPTDAQRDIIEATLMAVGSVVTAGPGENPFLTITTPNKKFLHWLDDHLSILTTGVRQYMAKADVRDRLATMTGIAPETIDANDQYVLNSRSLPFLREYKHTWIGDDTRHIPPDITITPQKRRILHALLGRVGRRGNRTAVEHHYVSTDIDHQTLDKLYGEFGPTYSTKQDGNTLVTLMNCQRFLDHIGDPIPGFEDKWPEHIEEPDIKCPACHGRYEGLSYHFTKSTACTPPEITPAQHEILSALLLAGAKLRLAETADAAQLYLTSTTESYLDWTADRLGWLANGVRESTSEAVARDLFADWTDRDDLDKYDINAAHELTTWMHPDLYEYYAGWFDDPHTFLSTLEPTPLRCKLVFARRGTVTTYEDRTNNVNISTGRIPLDDAALLDLFDSFDPRTTDDTLVLTDADAFLDYVGDPLPGCEARWQPDGEVKPRRHT